MPANISIADANEAIVGLKTDEQIAAVEDRQIIKSHLNILLLESEFLSSSRRSWSKFLIICVAVSIIFQISITFLIGFGELNFRGYESFISVTAGGAFIQIVALATIALKWIFGGRRPDEMLEEMRVSRNIHT